MFTAPSSQRKNVAPSSTLSNGQKTFTYDQVFGPSATQADVYERVVEPIVDEVLEGYNCTVFAYGQTGTGKTHTMEGRRDDDVLGVEDRRLAENAGIIPRAVKQVFDHLRNLTDEHSVRVSHLELYNEQLTDLLGPEDETGDSLRVYEDPQKGTFVQGLEDVVVRSEEEIFAVLDRSAQMRKTAETLMNKYSSRSHSIFSITIHIKESTPEGADLLKVGKLNLVDLAGSENVGRSGAVKGRAREAGNINQSLLTLGRVITALVDRHPHIPYRDSKLTRLLQESLGGRNKTCVIATVTPGSSSFEETASTLDYAYRAKSIKNRPTVNQMIAKHVLLKEYTEEISKLKRELDATRTKNGIYLTPEEFKRLNLVASQQKAEIGALETLSEENEIKLATMKDKLKKTQEALSRDQQILADTRQTLTKVSEELSHTKEELADTSQLRDENAFLVTQHVGNEDALNTQAQSLQDDLTACVSDVTSLHERIDAKTSIEDHNLRDISALKSAVDSSVKNLAMTLEAHQENQAQTLNGTQELLVQMASGLESGLLSISEKTNSILSSLAENDEEYSNVNAEGEKELQENAEKSYRELTKTMSCHTSLTSQKEEDIQKACGAIFESFANCQREVQRMMSHVKEFSKSTADGIGVFAEGHRTALGALNTQIRYGFAAQAKVMDEFKMNQKKEADVEREALKNAKAALMEQVTSAFTALVEDSEGRIARRLENADLSSAEILEQSKTIDGAMQKHEVLQKEESDGMCTKLEADVVALHKSLCERESQHEVEGTRIRNSAEQVDGHISELASECESKETAISAEVSTAKAALSEYVTKSHERRAAHSAKQENTVVQGQQGIKSESEAFSSDTNGHLSKLKEEVSGMEASVSDFVSEAGNQVRCELHEPIRQYNLLVDSDQNLVPAKRSWPPAAVLIRTPFHNALISQFRESEGLRDLPRENLGHNDPRKDEAHEHSDKENRSESERQIEAESSASDPQSSCESQEIEPAESCPTLEEVEEISVSTQENAEDFANSNVSLPRVEECDRPILSDTTNRRTLQRPKKVERLIRKKPSGIPLPRSRSGVRKFAL